MVGMASIREATAVYVRDVVRPLSPGLARRRPRLTRTHERAVDPQVLVVAVHLADGDPGRLWFPEDGSFVRVLNHSRTDGLPAWLERDDATAIVPSRSFDRA